PGAPASLGTARAVRRVAGHALSRPCAPRAAAPFRDAGRQRRARPPERPALLQPDEWPRRVGRADPPALRPGRAQARPRPASPRAAHRPVPPPRRRSATGVVLTIRRGGPAAAARIGRAGAFPPRLPPDRVR